MAATLVDDDGGGGCSETGLGCCDQTCMAHLRRGGRGVFVVLSHDDLCSVSVLKPQPLLTPPTPYRHPSTPTSFPSQHLNHPPHPPMTVTPAPQKLNLFSPHSPHPPMTVTPAPLPLSPLNTPSTPDRHPSTSPLPPSP
ncbi:hypothetical protein Pmani_024607 [Petrolisthes manimaculis]|uniref:Uncharacterized protein n=1 Tax=Petrolisthes manimaculis TaxID=1843537 RepID=A0AAE1U227_9EUCA|nr:hypothetical protein Pmani_024607 [Petrolisthes manimaculis]